MDERFETMTEYFEYLDSYTIDENPDYDFVSEDLDLLEDQYHPRLGFRPPKEFTCRLPIIGRSRNITKAIEYVLDEIAENCYEDACKLINNVESVHIFKDTGSRYLGRWVAFDWDISWRYYLGEYYDDFMSKKAGVILLNQKISKSLNLAKYVFAHECGHAADNLAGPANWLDANLFRTDYKEAAANSYIKRWGMGHLIDKVSQVDVITFEKLSVDKPFSWFDIPTI